MPGDWGLEVGLLAEVFKNTALKRICQIDLGFYEHKHRPISAVTESGIQKMTKDITKTIFRNLVELDGVDIDEAFLQSVNVLFKRAAQDRIRQHHADALFNGLNYSRHGEECMVEAFSKYMLSAGREYIQNPVDVHLPDWKRAISAMPDIREKLKDAALNDFNNYG